MNNDNEQREMHSALIEQLDTLGFFRFVRPGQVAGLKARFLKKPNLWVWTARVKRDFPADEERLVEGGVGTFLKTLNPVFKAAGVRLHKIEEQCGAEGYWIKVNGIRYELYSKELLQAANEQRSTALWETTTHRSFALINQLFQEAGSEERIFSLGGWNDHWAFVWTEAIHTLLRESSIWDDGLNSLTLHR